MGFRTYANTITIAQSATLSSAFNMGAFDDIALFIPVLNSTSMSLLGSPDTSSANFVQIQQADLGGAWALNAETGSKMIAIKADFGPVTHGKILLSAPQNAARHFVLIGKRP